MPNGDILVASAGITIVSDNGFSLNNNTVGTAAGNISLRTSYGAIDASGTNTINGSLSANGNGQMNLTGTTVTGSITTSGHINLTGGSIGGLITSTSNTITTNGTNLQGGARAQSGMNITGGLISGPFTMTSNNAATFSGVTMTSGSISGASTVSIVGGSTLGGPSSPITISSNSGEIQVNNSTVYGTLTAPGYSTVRISNGGAVYGTCNPDSTPTKACTPASTILGSWRMDEPYWNGAANEVIDSSGNNNHGSARIAAGATPTASTALVTPAFTSGSQSTCSYGQFDSTTAPIRTNTYLELSGFPELPSSFTFTAWIRSTNAGAQHQRILVRDDADNGWGLSLADGTGEPRLRFFNRKIQNMGTVTGGRNGNCGVFCLDTNTVIATNAWHFVAAAIDTTARTVTLYVYNASGSLLARTTGSFSGNWVDGTGTAAIGGETLASAEGRQSSFHFLGNIDEVEIYTGALTQSHIESLRTRVRTCPVISPHHYELQVPETSIACMATPVTVVACADSSSPCTNSFLAAGGTTANLATTGGTLANTTLAFSAGGVATTTLAHPLAADGTLANVALSGVQLPGLNAARCCRGSGCTVSNSCATTFNTAGLAFATSSAPNIALVPNQVAGLTDSSIILRAVRTPSGTPNLPIVGACEARITGTRTVQLAYECRNPTSCVLGQTLTLNSLSARANSNNANPILYHDRLLTFNASGTAPVPLNYSDVGQLRLHANLVLAANAPEPATTLRGTSNEFVVKPHTIAVSQVTGNPGTTSSGSGFRAAGEAFGVQLEVRNANGQPTPNFGNEENSQRSGVSVEIGSLVYPAGGNPGVFTQTGAFTAVSPAGTLTNSNLRWNEVGSITLRPRLNAYLGVSEAGTGGLASHTLSGTIGRFYPQEFLLVNPQINDGCSGFSYMGQPFNLSYRMEARNQQGALTSNYSAPGYARRATPVYVAEDNDNMINRGSRLQVPAVDWMSGALNINTSTALFNRQTSTQPDGPFGNLQFGVGLTGDGDNRVLAGRNMDAESTGICTENTCTAVRLGTPRVVRFGRLRLDDAFGPETAPLPVNFVTEYWAAGNFWIQASTDTCTRIPRPAISYSATGPISVEANRTVPMGSGSTTGTYRNLDATSVIFENGNAGHFFTAPGTGTGSFDVEIDLENLPWLRHDWNQNGNFNDDIRLRANFGFGQYRGHDRIIYWREVFE